MLRRLIVLIGVALLAAPVLAQTDDEIVLAQITEALEGFYELDSMAMTGTLVIEQEIGVQGMTVNQTITQELEVIYDFKEGAVAGVYAVLNQAIESMLGSGTMLMEMIYIDDTLYLRISEVTGLLAAAAFPDRWINLAEEAGEVPGLEAFNAEQLIATFDLASLFPYNSETVLDIEQIAPLELEDGTELTGFALTMNPPAIMETTQVASTLSGLGLQGADMEQMLADMAENMEVEYRVWISEQDGLIRHMESDTVVNEVELTVMGQVVTLAQVATGVFDYGDFDAPVDITVPEDEDE